MSEAPSPFSKHNPKLQIAWDSTSLRSLMTCPRQYQYAIIEGWRQPGEVTDLDFGGFFASSVETYKKARLSGKSKEEATLGATRYVINATYTPEHGPWGGRYEELWQCSGTNPYRNARGNRAKCPHAHKGVWYPAPAPDICGECGSATCKNRQWIPDDKSKNRHTLIGLVVQYCDEQPESPSEGAYPYKFPNGQPAVELSFKMPLPWHTNLAESWKNPETYILCGHLDSIMKFGDEIFISDNKTTRKPLSFSYFSQYSPNIQIDVYDLAGNLMYPGLGIKGVMIEGAQVLQEGSRFGIGIQYRSDALREELLTDLEYWIRQAEKFAIEDHWPMNRASCYLCPFKSICSKEPEVRQRYLEAAFVKRPWNPLQER